MDHDSPDRAAGRRPGLVALGLLGYAYVLGVLVGLLVLAAGAVVLLPRPVMVVWVVLPLVGCAIGFARALVVRAPRPEGLRLAERDAAPPEEGHGRVEPDAERHGANLTAGSGPGEPGPSTSRAPFSVGAGLARPAPYPNSSR